MTIFFFDRFLDRTYSEINVIFNISDKKINELEIHTGNPLIVFFDKNLKIEKSYYLDKEREKKIISNQ